MRLICFPHAGGFASYYNPMKRLQKEGIDVITYEYAGRGRRYGEAFYKNAEECIQSIYRELTKENSNEEYAFFGHSMGAYIAYEIALQMQLDSRPGPNALFLSGAVPPEYATESGIDITDDAQVVSYLQSMDGLAPEIISYESFMKMLLPVVKSDLKMLEDYTLRTQEQPFSFPICMFYGEKDDKLVSPEKMSEWGKKAASYKEFIFPGGHFYLQEFWDCILLEIKKTLMEKQG
ncbi:MAG: alpha/beta hydrolase [Lachnospiraceae bacterium]|nr:alpha/beta hydrolase [Lachnospiraceae bacterium]